MVSGLLKINFPMKIFDFLVSGLWKIDFSMKIFVCLVSGLLKINFSMTVFVFFGVRSIENCFFNESVCFLASGIVEDGAVHVFSFVFIMFLGPELVFQ